MKIVQSWDTAAKDGAMHDFSVCTTWLAAKDDYYLLDLTRGRYSTLAYATPRLPSRKSTSPIWC